jgi:hypothetical protein
VRRQPRFTGGHDPVVFWFTVPSQALQVLPLFALAHGVELTRAGAFQVG